MAKTYKIESRELVALAFAAQRVNGGLHRDNRYFDPEKDAFVEVVPNKTLMFNSFAFEPGSNPELVPTDEDRAQADAAISAIQGDVLIKKLADRRVAISNLISAKPSASLLAPNVTAAWLHSCPRPMLAC